MNGSDPPSSSTDFLISLAAIDASGLEPDGLLVDYHLDGGNGVAAIGELRRRLGRHVPAIVITADRSLHVREESRAEAGDGEAEDEVRP